MLNVSLNTSNKRKGKQIFFFYSFRTQENGEIRGVFFCDAKSRRIMGYLLMQYVLIQHFGQTIMTCYVHQLLASTIMGKHQFLDVVYLMMKQLMQ